MGPLDQAPMRSRTPVRSRATAPPTAADISTTRQQDRVSRFQSQTPAGGATPILTVDSGRRRRGMAARGSMHAVGFPTVVWSADVLRHEPGAEIWVGVSTPGTEVPERARVLLEAVTAAGATVINAQAYDDTVLRAVHDSALVDHLRTSAEQWSQGPYEELVGQDRVVPYVFPTPGMLDGLPAREPAATHARAGLYCYDTMTLVGPGTWQAARAAVDVALTAADLVADGTAASYALVRPPGHHAT